jgi:hypothetical protein
MKVEKHITLYLNEAEADALTKLLGAYSDKCKVKLGLTLDEAKLITQMWKKLPHPEEQE